MVDYRSVPSWHIAMPSGGGVHSIGHQARAEEPLLLVRPTVDPPSQAEPVEELTHEHETATVGDVLRAVTDA